MLQGAEIAMAVIGLYALICGRLTLTERSVVVGAKARVLGSLAILPGLLTLTTYLFVRSLAKPVELPWLWIAQLVAIIGCTLLIYVLGLRWAVKPASADPG